MFSLEGSLQPPHLGKGINTNTVFQFHLHYSSKSQHLTLYLVLHSTFTRSLLVCLSVCTLYMIFHGLVIIPQNYFQQINLQRTFEPPTVVHIPQLINTTGMILQTITEGNSESCTDVIYTCDGRAPVPSLMMATSTSNMTMVDASWGAMVLLSKLPKFNQTCFAFFQLSDQYFGVDGRRLHMVWGRLPITALVLSLFPKAQYMLYMDTDATLSSARHTPTDMYHALSYDGYGSDATFQHLSPGLIVNKPMTGWLCHQCRYLNLNHGCFNTGALLWHRSNGMQNILQHWWESRLHNTTQNLFVKEGNTRVRAFHGWGSGNREKMSEQNRLMYLFNTDPDVNKEVWPVPRAASRFTNTTSCPEDTLHHLPCLQNDRIKFAEWELETPSCYINHYADIKPQVIEVLKTMRGFMG